MEQCFSGGQEVRVSAAGRIMKAAEERGKMHVWGRVPVDTVGRGAGEMIHLLVRMGVGTFYLVLLGQKKTVDFAVGQGFVHDDQPAIAALCHF